MKEIFSELVIFSQAIVPELIESKFLFNPDSRITKWETIYLWKENVKSKMVHQYNAITLNWEKNENMNLNDHVMLIFDKIYPDKKNFITNLWLFEYYINIKVYSDQEPIVSFPYSTLKLMWEYWIGLDIDQYIIRP